MKQKYITQWRHSINYTWKLEFYNTFKHCYEISSYLNLTRKTINRKALVKLRVSNHDLWSKLEDITKHLTTKGYVQFVTPMQLKMKFTSSAIARNISNLIRNEFFAQIQSHLHKFSSYLTRTWWLNWWTPKIFILIYDWRILFHYWIICVTVSCRLRMMSLDYLLLIS